ncbi:hypothetical protein [Trichormus azollae]|uniref:hypothetical protein n=1 Tax=Trichormus azollae TaxID=1164 RepID=UPI00325EC496
MTFSNYKTISEVLKAFQVINTGDNFISEMTFTTSHYFYEDLELIIRDTVVDNSELLIHEHLNLLRSQRSLENLPPTFCLIKL